MNNSPPLHRCPSCSAEIPSEAPEGLCPKCLLLGVASAIGPQSDPASSIAGSGSLAGRVNRPHEVNNAVPPTIAELASAFPQLEILGLIGRGGMGFVYKAKQPKLDRYVALKILPGHLADEPSFRERFEREARVLAKLQHPLIVSVYDFGEAVAAPQTGNTTGTPLPRPQTDKLQNSTTSQATPANQTPSSTSDSLSHRGNDNPILNPSLDAVKPAVPAVFYLVLEFVDGVNLREAMRAGRFTPEQALAIVPQVCEALQYAHSKGVLHRDIKPENILLDTEGRVKIADFGIAKVLGPDLEPSSNLVSDRFVSESELAVTRLTATGSVLGTPLYMAPEQLIRPNTVDHRADIFSLGVVFYEMLTGELPMGRFAPPSEKSLVDQRIDEVVMRALAKERELRQQSAGEMKVEVDTIVSNPNKSPNSRRFNAEKAAAGFHARSSGQAVSANRESPWPRRFFWLIASMFGMVLMVIALFVIALIIPVMLRGPSPHRSPNSHDAEVRTTLEVSGISPNTNEPPPLVDTNDQPVGVEQIPATNSETSSQAKRLGLIEVFANVDEWRGSNAIVVHGANERVEVEPYFASLVELPSSTDSPTWREVNSAGQTVLVSPHHAPYPCDYLAVDRLNGEGRPTTRGYCLSPGAYDFRPEATKNAWHGLSDAKGRAEFATSILRLIREHASKTDASASDWQTAARTAHLRFRFVPKSISKLDVPEECLVILSDGSRTILTRDGSRFTKHELDSTDLIRELPDRIQAQTTPNVTSEIQEFLNVLHAAVRQQKWEVLRDAMTEDCRDDWIMEIIASCEILHGNLLIIPDNAVKEHSLAIFNSLKEMFAGLQQYRYVISDVDQKRLRRRGESLKTMNTAEQRQYRIDLLKTTFGNRNEAGEMAVLVLTYAEELDRSRMVIDLSTVSDLHVEPDLRRPEQLNAEGTWKSRNGKLTPIRLVRSAFNGEQSWRIDSLVGESVLTNPSASMFSDLVKPSTATPESDSPANASEPDNRQK